MQRRRRGQRSKPTAKDAGESQPYSRRWEHDRHNHTGGYGHNRWSGSYHSPQPRDPLVYSLAKPVIRQEEEIKLLQQDTSMVLWLNSGGDSMLNHLYTTAVEFKRKQQAEPTWGLAHMPLKASHGPVPLQGVEGPPSEGHKQSRAAEQSQGDGVERLGRLALSGVEPETKSIGARQNQGPGVGDRDVQQARALRGAHQTGCGASLSLHTASDRNYGGEKDLSSWTCQSGTSMPRRSGIYWWNFRAAVSSNLSV